jgi:hypothetical protein
LKQVVVLLHYQIEFQDFNNAVDLFINRSACVAAYLKDENETENARIIFGQQATYPCKT